MVKKRRKINTKRMAIVLMIPVICLVLLIANFTKIRLSIKGYDRDAKKVVLNLDSSEIHDILDYNHVIDISKWDRVKNNSHYVLYDTYYRMTKYKTSKVVYYVDAYYERMEDLNFLGYTTSFLFKNSDLYSISTLDSLITSNIPYEKTKKYLAVKGAQFGDVKGYSDLESSPLKTVLKVSYPGIDSSKKNGRSYTILSPEDSLVLVKEGFSLGSDYAPSDLRKVNVPYASQPAKLRKEAADAFEKMYKAALKKDHHLVIKTSYRSYDAQKAAYNEAFSNYGSTYKLNAVSSAGYNEHQTGYSVNLTCQDVADGIYNTFEETSDYNWLEQNAYKYGFILRYPEKSSKKTGVENETDHFRYVGKDVAKEIYLKNWVFEDYILHHGFTYNMRLN